MTGPDPDEDGYEPVRERRRRERAPPAPPPVPVDDGEPADCPVVALGQRDGTYWLLSPSGELRAVDHRTLRSPGGLDGLFDGDVTWLLDRFPVTGRGGRPTGEVDVHAAGRWLQRACAIAGLWDASLPVRGPGVWADGTDGLVVSTGDALSLDGGRTWQRPGLRRPEALYVAAPALPRPGLRDPGPEPAHDLLDDLGRWAWERPEMAELWLGWLGGALLGDGHDWRVHLLVRGPYGAGKSSLGRLAAAALGGQGQTLLTSTSEAALRQQFTNEARAILLDETEHDRKGRSVDVVGLIRQMSDQGGAAVTRGTLAGRHQAWRVAGAAYLTAIVPPDLSPQDRSRILELTVRALPDDTPAAAAAEVRAALRRAADASPGLRARALAGWDRFRATARVWREALALTGASARATDQVATLLAGRDLLARDDAPGAAEAEAELVRWRWLLAGLAEESEDDGHGARALAHLWGSASELWRSGDRRTIGEEVMLALNAAPDSPDRRRIESVGLMVVDRTLVAGGPRGRWILVANRHEGLRRLFAGTAWEDYGWSRVLGDLDGVFPWVRVDPRAPFFAGARSRALALPEAWWPRREEHEISERWER